MNNNQVQAVAGRGRKVNKDVIVPNTVPYISDLFKDFVSHYQGTFFKENETDKMLYERMCEWHDMLFHKHEFSTDVVRAVIEYYENLPNSPRYRGGPCRSVKVPDLEDVIEQCRREQQKLSKPSNKAFVNDYRRQIRIMTERNA